MFLFFLYVKYTGSGIKGWKYLFIEFCFDVLEVWVFKGRTFLVGVIIGFIEANYYGFIGLLN